MLQVRIARALPLPRSQPLDRPYLLQATQSIPALGVEEGDLVVLRPEGEGRVSLTRHLLPGPGTIAAALCSGRLRLVTDPDPPSGEAAQTPPESHRGRAGCPPPALRHLKLLEPE